MATGFLSRYRSLTGRNEAAVFITGLITAMMQTVLIREIFAVVAGNELVIGVVLAIWLAATASGSAVAAYFPLKQGNLVLLWLVVSFTIGLIGIRAIRLLLPTGSSLSPLMLVPILFVCETPGAFFGGYVFGGLVQNRAGVPVYRWEQAGTLTGLVLLSLLLLLGVPNWSIAAFALLFSLPFYQSKVWMIIAFSSAVFLLLYNGYTVAWKYPLPLTMVSYTPEAEVAVASIDDQTIVFVNGTMHQTSFGTPTIEQAVHTPMGMHGNPRKVLVINSTGHIEEIQKYQKSLVQCIRTDHLIKDTLCPHGTLSTLTEKYFDVVIMGCAMPDNGSTSRFFTRSFFVKIHELVGDSGIFSFTLPFQTEYLDHREEKLRSILISTLKSVFNNVKVFPGEGFTFVASDASYVFPLECNVQNEYFETVILAGQTAKRIAQANKPPTNRLLHTTSHPRILKVTLDQYLSIFTLRPWMFIVGIVILSTALLLLLKRLTIDVISVGTSGIGTGIFSVAILLLYQSVHGTVYSHLSLLLLSLAAGFAIGGYVHKFPFSDLIFGVITGGFLLTLAVVSEPPEILFYLGNGVVGFLAAAQFVTRKTKKVDILYTADCIGGVIGTALAATVFVPMVGMKVVGCGIIAIKIIIETGNYIICSKQ